MPSPLDGLKAAEAQPVVNTASRPKGRARLAQERASLSSLALALGQPAHLAEGVQQ